MKKLFTIYCLFLFVGASAQRFPDAVFLPNIRTAKLFSQNNQESMAIVRLNSTDLLELHFDDVDPTPKNYYYSLELCNADWTPADVNTFDYISGFTQVHLSEFRPSSITQSRYIHYQTLLPNKNCMPTKSGNYMLRVFLDGDTSQVAFTKRMFVVDYNKAMISAIVQQPYDNQLNKTHQKLQLSVNTMALNPINPQQQIQVVILQNYRWDNAVSNIIPSFIRESMLEYNSEVDCLFPAGREYRWVDLRSYKFSSERIDKIDKEANPNEVYLRADGVRTNMRYIYMVDYNGWYDINTTENINPWWQTDYAKVHFSFVPPNNQPFTNRDVYILGDLTGNKLGNSGKMKFNAEKGIYEKTLLLKQGYYFYTYATAPQKVTFPVGDVSITDGNYWETENEYTVLVYYRSYNGRHDELVALSTVNSKNLSLRN
ncbi:MAG: DUF5103 domain-containing protein [Bacteroidota bacterium]